MQPYTYRCITFTAALQNYRATDWFHALELETLGSADSNPDDKGYKISMIQAVFVNDPF